MRISNGVRLAASCSGACFGSGAVAFFSDGATFLSDGAGSVLVGMSNGDEVSAAGSVCGLASGEIEFFLTGSDLLGGDIGGVFGFAVEEILWGTFGCVFMGKLDGYGWCMEWCTCGWMVW